MMEFYFDFKRQKFGVLCLLDTVGYTNINWSWYVNTLPVLRRAPVPRKYHALVPRAKHEELRVMVLSGYWH